MKKYSCSLFLLIFLSGCSISFTGKYGNELTPSCAPPSQCLPTPDDFLIKSNYNAADDLVGALIQFKDKSQPLLMSTVANIDDLESSSTLGRLISEHVSARMTQIGYRVIEIKLQRSAYLKKNEGEFMLSRHVLDVASSHSVQAVVVGTYSIAKNKIFVSLKVVQPQTNYVFSAVDYTIPLNDEIRHLILSKATLSNY